VRADSRVKEAYLGSLLDEEGASMPVADTPQSSSRAGA
jgi:hypothetical protein